ncbi:DUF169 domain-containing protein [Vulcanisaeta sp. JCM 14467]|uniref:DUF169 domain-containing protein n=1 Tax=Vulcanisaeta sp. JCM 14467 TaxID=1295370 RepID=UPI002093C4A3|nr:DUF169 domain-containing protein [Vulcanisaeta sp. JCM 14467]
MQSVEDLRRIGRELRGELGLRTYPVGIRFCLEPCDLTGFRRPRDFGIHMTACQVINAARYGWSMAFTLEDMFCIGGAYLFGWCPSTQGSLKRQLAGIHPVMMRRSALTQGSWRTHCQRVVLGRSWWRHWSALISYQT